MSKKIIILNAVIYLLFVLLTLTLIFNIAGIHKINIAVSHWIQLFHNNYLDILLSYLTFLMSGEVCVFFSIIFSIYCYIYYRPIYLLTWLFILGVVIELLIKHYIPMPDINLEHRNIWDMGIIVATNYSYPSGHALRTAFFALFLSYFVIRYLNWNRYSIILLAGIITFLLLYSRSYLGVHWFVDVVGGALLGAALGLTAIIITEKKLKGHKRGANILPQS